LGYLRILGQGRNKNMNEREQKIADQLMQNIMESSLVGLHQSILDYKNFLDAVHSRIQIIKKQHEFI